jgi:hypothetical protein
LERRFTLRFGDKSTATEKEIKREAKSNKREEAERFMDRNEQQKTANHVQ